MIRQGHQGLVAKTGGRAGGDAIEFYMGLGAIVKIISSWPKGLGQARQAVAEKFRQGALCRQGDGNTRSPGRCEGRRDVDLPDARKTKTAATRTRTRATL